MKLATLLNKTLNQNKHVPLRKLRREAAKQGLTIEIDRIGRDIGYWIDGGDDSVLEGERYCSSKEELSYKLSEF
jgi:Zn-finger nucleic acid-binding protein